MNADSVVITYENVEEEIRRYPRRNIPVVDYTGMDTIESDEESYDEELESDEEEDQSADNMTESEYLEMLAEIEEEERIQIENEKNNTNKNSNEIYEYRIESEHIRELRNNNPKYSNETDAEHFDRIYNMACDEKRKDEDPLADVDEVKKGIYYHICNFIRYYCA